nr:MAG TPA: hypothetical protein [Caudoviricetes sp.]
MTNIKISVHPFGRKLEWRGWGTSRLPCEPPTTNALTV